MTDLRKKYISYMRYKNYSVRTELKKDANKFLENDLSCGYKYIPAILKLYDFYDNNRKKYRTFDDFYPTLLKVFEDKI